MLYLIRDAPEFLSGTTIFCDGDRQRPRPCPEVEEPDAEKPSPAEDEPKPHVDEPGPDVDDPGPDVDEPGPTEFVLGRDYEVEDGLVVFTASYLLAKGKCCRLGCRNCPWGFSGRASSRGRGRPFTENRARLRILGIPCEPWRDRPVVYAEYSVC